MYFHKSKTPIFAVVVIAGTVAAIIATSVFTVLVGCAFYLVRLEKKYDVYHLLCRKYYKRCFAVCFARSVIPPAVFYLLLI